MLTRIDLKHFKCFEGMRLPLGPLTLLAGPNASGKSTVLQALVLLNQTIREHEWSKRLLLNGSSIQLGTVADVIDKVHGRFSFELGLLDDEHSYLWTFGRNSAQDENSSDSVDRSDMSVEVTSVEIGGTVHQSRKTLRFLLPPETTNVTDSLAARLRDLTYITAERIGPRDVYQLEDRQAATVVGTTGEHTASVLYWGRDEKVNDELVLPGTVNTRLRQVEARMGQFFPGCEFVLSKVQNANAVTIGFRTSAETDFHRPIHVGFGLTQIFPIVVAALSAGKDHIILIENPEVHLHPAGQALMGQFLGDVTRSGVQVIIETHSDHVLNGIRRSVKARRLDEEKVLIHFFRSDFEKEAQVVTPILDSRGNIDTWPKGFFDQFDKDLNYFAGWGD
ncbi:MAG: DUF3696 domain-containing protein [bacterium]|nr:DUF3696 domain-containing protein [bacterium]